MHRKTVVARAAVLVAGLICLGAAPAGGLKTTSEIKGVTFTALARLPRSPETTPLDDYCEPYRLKKQSATAKRVESLGCFVTSEASLGRYHVVTFASGFDAGTSMICYARNTNIGVFDGGRLVALAYPAKASKAILQSVEPVEGGALLVWPDPPGFPVGELHLGAEGLRLTGIAAERTFCHRRAVVPNVYGKPITVARKILIAHGWTPQRAKERPSENDLARAFIKRGIIEAESCSGTGVGYCAYNYRGPAGVLGVTTAGEADPTDNTVVGYNVACRAK